jgi:hypothetical protein
VRRAGKGKQLVIGNGAETEVNAGLVELIKEAFAIRNQFLSTWARFSPQIKSTPFCDEN